MNRAERLLALLELLRQHRRAVRGEQLAARLSISLRTLYRDIASLQAQGALIDGEAGVGYRLRPGHALPPLMFRGDEIEALALGMSWVAKRSNDEQLAGAARNALAKLRAVLPTAARAELDASPLLVPPGDAPPFDAALLPQLRAALREQRKLLLDYRDVQGRASERLVWPFALGFFESSRVLSAWCELRGAVRHFRLDRMKTCLTLDEVYPGSRQALLRIWRASEGFGCEAEDY